MRLTRHWFPTSVFLIIALAVLIWAAIGFLTGQSPTILSPAEIKGVIQFAYPEMVTVNRPFTLQVQVDTGKQRVNAVGLYFRFDASAMQLLSQDTRSSFCQFYPEKKYDNNLGTIQLACGSPHPGFSGENTIMSLEFMPLKVGTAKIYTSEDSQLLLSDGKGTNILNNYPQADIQIGNLP